jgi:phage terminase Nu1 subunit (DNA packaging protein)
LSHLSLTEIAELAGVKAETVAKRLRARGLKPASSNGRAQLFDSVAALPIALGVGGPTTERTRLDAARADLAELELRRRRGELLEVADVRDTWASRALSWKERLRSLPAEATVHVPAFTPAMGRKLLELINATLTELADGNYAPRSPRRRSKARK